MVNINPPHFITIKSQSPSGQFNSSIKVQSKLELPCLLHDTKDKWVWQHLLHHNALTYQSLAWLSLHTTEHLGVSCHWPGNDQAPHSLIFALSVMITARLLTHSLKNL